jgi:hypothetical protein
MEETSVMDSAAVSLEDIALCFRAAVRRRGHALAALECAVDPVMVTGMTALRMRSERRLGELLLDLIRRWPDPKLCAPLCFLGDFVLDRGKSI